MMLLWRLKDFRFQRYESGTRELIGPSCEMTASKLKYLNSGRKLRRWKRVAHIASPQTRRSGKYRVYRSHTRLYVDFSWDSVARKNSFAFGVNDAKATTSQASKLTQVKRCEYSQHFCCERSIKGALKSKVKASMQGSFRWLSTFYWLGNERWVVDEQHKEQKRHLGADVSPAHRSSLSGEGMKFILKSNNISEHML